MQSAKCKIKGENFDTAILGRGELNAECRVQNAELRVRTLIPPYPVGERLAAPACFYGQSRTPVPTMVRLLKKREAERLPYSLTIPSSVGEGSPLPFVFSGRRGADPYQV